jgi:P pilus assembly chaperone PapD
MRTFGLSAWCVLALLAGLVPEAAWAVKVAPQVIVIGPRDRGAELTVVNPGEQPVEVDVQVMFGYEIANADGSIETTYPTGPSPRSAVDWVRVWPRRVRLQPGQQQSVRLLVKAPGSIKDFEGWARVQVREQGDSPVPKAVDGVQMQLGVTTQQRIPLFVRRGNPRADLAFDGLEIRSVGTADSPEIEVRYRSDVSGGAAFVGEVVGRVKAGDIVLGEARKTLAVFEPGVRVIRIPYASSDAKGERVVELESLRSHPALSPDEVVRGQDASARAPLPR